MFPRGAFAPNERNGGVPEHRPLILVTGGTGFVGRAVLSALADAGAFVRAVVRPGAERKLDGVPGLEHIVETADLFAETSEWWQDVCSGVQSVLHVAWYAEPGKYLQSPFNVDCLEGTLRLAKGAVAAGVSRFVGIGTCFEYDLSAGVLCVDTPLRPETPYAGAKAAAFLALSTYLPMAGVSFAWCRLFYLFGKGEDQRRLVPYLRSRLSAGEKVDLTSGDQIRDYLDVDDAGKMIAGIVMGDRTGVVNICSGVPVTVRQLAESIADEFQRRDLLCFGTRPDNLTDPRCVVGRPNL
ncbi:MAG: NAD(P)-dependent oxidoreductase [Telmatospirillum sp.]|nr:NAD(P)-dependent oxidoreductase [Telmatospirillum sp.]